MMKTSHLRMCEASFFFLLQMLRSEDSSFSLGRGILRYHFEDRLNIYHSRYVSQFKGSLVLVPQFYKTMFYACKIV